MGRGREGVLFAEITSLMYDPRFLAAFLQNTLQ